MAGLEMKYFVLKPRSKTIEDRYADASRFAMRAYASVIEDINPKLAKSLIEWADKEDARELIID